MRTIVVRRTLRAPIERVFDILSDHAGYAAFPGVRSAALIRRGPDDEPNGLGAVREIDTGLAWFREEVTAFQRPTRMEYVITEARPSVRHRGGVITLTADEGATRVEWTSTFAVELPVASELATRLAARAMTRAFETVLSAAEKRANSW